MLFSRGKSEMVTPEAALPGRTDQTMPVPAEHFVNGHPLTPPWPDGYQTAVFGLGCFWGAERKFWETKGVCSTAVGYAGGYTPNPTLRRGLQRPDRPCRGRPRGVRSRAGQLRPAPEGVLGERTTRRRACARATTSARSTAPPSTTRTRRSSEAAEASKAMFEEKLDAAGYGGITTEIAPAGAFFYAEPYHQQYLAKNPGGYCGLGGTGVSCPIGVASAD